MIKKYILWTTYAVIVGLLVFGAVNRTAAKSDQGVLVGRPAAADQKIQGEGGSWNSDRNGDVDNVEHEEIPTDHDWVEISGVVLAFDSRTLVIQADYVGELEIAGRAWRFIQESGYLPVVGNKVILNGFYENDEYKIANLRDINSEEIVMIRDVAGHPLWR